MLRNNGEKGNGDSYTPKVVSINPGDGVVPGVIYASESDNLVTGWSSTGEDASQVYGSFLTPTTTTTTTSSTFSIGNRASLSSPTTTSTPYSPLYDCKFVNSTIPSTLKPGDTFTGFITIKNTGKMAWTAGTILFGLQPFGDALNFGLGNILLPDGVTVEPGQEYSFPVTFTVPQLTPTPMWEPTPYSRPTSVKH